MDYLDPKNLRNHRIRLFIGYGLVAVAIGLLVVILLFLAYGYNYKQGEVVRDGLVFVSSQPTNARLYVNGKYQGNTSQRLQLQADDYRVTMSRAGYLSWNRNIVVAGGKIERFDYPILFPKKLTTLVNDRFTAAPAIASESPDNHKLLIQFSGQPRYFQLYNLSVASQLQTTRLVLPANVLTPYQGQQSMSVVQWAQDGEHVLLKHKYGASYEYILLDTANAANSLNLNAALGLSPSSLTLDNDYYDQYFVYDATDRTLSLASLGSQKVKKLLNNVVNYTNQDGNILYLESSDNGKSLRVMYYDGNKNYPIQATVPSGKYLLDLTKSNGDQYIVVTSVKDGVVDIYKNPLSTVTNMPSKYPKVSQTIRIKNPSYQSVSPENGYIMIESGQNFAVYDIALGQAHTYRMPYKLDAPQSSASWMREGQLDYVTGGKLVVFDFDGLNAHVLMAADPHYMAFFDINYHYGYTLTANTDRSSDAKMLLTQTPLLTKADL